MALDAGALRAAILTWPEPGSVDWHGDNTYTAKLPMALAVGVFLKETEEAWRVSG